MQQDILDRAANIKLVIFDVDGVLTDGSLYICDSGQEYKAFHSKDGFGMKALMKSGVEIGIITARKSKLVSHRMESLGINHVFQGQLEKLPAFLQLAEQLGLSHDQIAYVGDDVVDLPILSRVGLSVGTQDCHQALLPHIHWQTELPGGRGAAREVCDLIMQSQGKLDSFIEVFLK